MGEVVKLNDTAANDVPRMLRETADRIENGDLPDTDMAMFTMKAEDSVYVFGWGERATSLPDMYTLVSYVSNILLSKY